VTFGTPDADSLALRFLAMDCTRAALQQLAAETRDPPVINLYLNVGMGEGDRWLWK